MVYTGADSGVPVGDRATWLGESAPKNLTNEPICPAVNVDLEASLRLG